jgi:hypothetical protein
MLSSFSESIEKLFYERKSEYVRRHGRLFDHPLVVL